MNYVRAASALNPQYHDPSPSARARILMIRTADPLAQRLLVDLELLGHATASICHIAEYKAGAAFQPDVIIADLNVLAGLVRKTLQTLDSGGVHCPVIAIRDDHPGASPGNANDDAIDHPLLGRLSSFGDIAPLSHLLRKVPIAHRDARKCDRLFVQRLIACDRLIENIDHLFLPKIDLQTGEVAGFEALARLRNRPALNPELIFSGARYTSLESVATIKAAEKAFDLWRSLDIEGRPVSVAFNCSLPVLVDPRFRHSLKQLLQRRNVPSTAFIIELTEDGKSVSLDKAVEAMIALEKLGVRFSLDDFGKGASNFDRLFRMPIEELKIDRETFQYSIENEHGISILRELAGLCRDRNIQTVIEGIETEAQLSIARDLGATLGQGFYWGRPMGAGAFANIR